MSARDSTGESDLARALGLAHRAIARRDRTVAEVYTALECNGVEPDTIPAVILALEQSGLLDDARFAQRFAEDKRSLEGWGPERIERDLARRGVAGDLIAAALASRDGGEELEAALALLARRTGPPGDDRERERAWRMLVRKGYPPEMAYEALRAHEGRHAA